MATTKNPAPFGAPTIDTTDWIDERFGFAPYWNPNEGESIVCKLVARDDRDPEFVRFLVEALAPTKCFTGPKEDAKPELVEAGQTFTLSAYYSVDQKFSEYMELGVFPTLQLTAAEKIKLKKDPRKTVWKFTAKLHPDTAKQLSAARQAKALNGGNPAGRPALET